MFYYLVHTIYFYTEMPFGRAPVLEVDGTKIAGSLNILRYLGITFGKYLTNDIKCVHVRPHACKAV